MDLSLCPRPAPATGGSPSPTETTRVRPRRWTALAACLCLAAAACGDGPTSGSGPADRTLNPSLGCALATEALFDGGSGRDGIPALTDPLLVSLDDPAARYVDDYVVQTADDPGSIEARVVGLFLGDVPVAVPYNILWWHEIVNLDIGGRRVAVTHCPLTGSSLVFDLDEAGIERLGVSGLIFENNLVMFDEGSESLWPQLCLGAVTGPRAGTSLAQLPAVDMRWETWKARYPQSLVISSETGFERNYDRYPYRFYETSRLLLFPMSGTLDERRPLKERIFGVGDGSSGIAFPFGELRGTTSGNLALGVTVGNTRVLVLWDGEGAAPGAFFPRTEDGTELTFRASEQGFTDNETGSTWNAAGFAEAGPLAGQQLEMLQESFIALWFAWAAFHPDTRIWTRE